MTARAAGRQVREAKPGEKCPCGRPAKAVLVGLLGDTPTCQDPATYAKEIARRYWLSRGGILPGAGNSGSR